MFLLCSVGTEITINSNKIDTRWNTYWLDNPKQYPPYYVGQMYWESGTCNLYRQIKNYTLHYSYDLSKKFLV